MSEIITQSTETLMSIEELCTLLETWKEKSKSDKASDGTFETIRVKVSVTPTSSEYRMSSPTAYCLYHKEETRHSLRLEFVEYTWVKNDVPVLQPV